MGKRYRLETTNRSKCQERNKKYVIFCLLWKEGVLMYCQQNFIYLFIYSFFIVFL